MYRKALSGLTLLYLVFLFSLLCVKELSLNRQACVTAEGSAVKKEVSTLGIANSAISQQRVLDVLELEKKQTLAEKDMEMLLRIVEAEAGNQDVEGRILVANVVLNRVENDKFPDNVTDVVLQKSGNGKYQFSPVRSGRIWRVKISEKTSEAVGRALEGEDLSEGALYFAARKYADSGSMRWFDEHLTYLFEHGGHEFYR